MERRISVGIFRSKYVDHLQRWSQIFRSEETETNLPIWIPTEISGIFGIMESTQCVRNNVSSFARAFKKNFIFDPKASEPCQNIDISNVAKHRVMFVHVTFIVVKCSKCHMSDCFLLAGGDNRCRIYSRVVWVSLADSLLPLSFVLALLRLNSG